MDPKLLVSIRIADKPGRQHFYSLLEPTNLYMAYVFMIAVFNVGPQQSTKHNQLGGRY